MRNIENIEKKEYDNITQAVYEYANTINNNFKSNINIVKDTSDLPIDYILQKQTTIFQKAKQMFSNVGKKVFVNNGENIYVSNGDIKESIAKTVRNKEQKKLLSEHMEIFRNLGKIIEQGQIIAKGDETKKRLQYKNWSYYATPITIDGEKYIVQFDTVLRNNNQKHFRLERIYSLNEMIKKQVAPTEKINNQSVTRFVEQPVSYEDNTINSPKSKVLSSNSNMHENKNNT